MGPWSLRNPQSLQKMHAMTWKIAHCVEKFASRSAPPTGGGGSTSPPASSGRGCWGLRSKVVSRSRFSTLVCCLAFFLSAKSRYAAYQNTSKKVRNTGRSSRHFLLMFRSYKLFPYSAQISVVSGVVLGPKIIKIRDFRGPGGPKATPNHQK